MLVARNGWFVMDVIHGCHNTELEWIMISVFEVLRVSGDGTQLKMYPLNILAIQMISGRLNPRLN